MYAGSDIVDMKVEQYKAQEAMVLSALQGKDINDGMKKIADMEKKLRKAKSGEKTEGEHHGLEKDEFLTLMYEWEEVSPISQNSGLNALFLGSFIFTLLLAAAVILSLPVEWELSGSGRGASKKPRRA